MMMAWQFMHERKMMNEHEIEVAVAGTKVRYRLIKPSSTLRPCEHHISEYGLRKKKLLRVHGAADGSATVEQYAL